MNGVLTVRRPQEQWGQTMSESSSANAAQISAVEASLSRLIGRCDLAVSLGIATATLDRKTAAEKLPRPIKIGSRVLWSRQVIDRWVELGCPDRETFEALTAK